MRISDWSSDVCSSDLRWGSVSEDSIGLTVGSDNIGAGEAAGAHLIAIGRRRIAFQGDASAHAPEFQDRYTGLCGAMAAAGRAAARAVRQHPGPTEETGHTPANDGRRTRLKTIPNR